MSVEQAFDLNLPSDPNERQRLKTMMDQAVLALTTIESQNVTLRETLAEIKEEFDIPVEFLRQIATSQVKENFSKNRQKAEAKFSLVDDYRSIILKED